jgi:hypothetical protein
MNDLKMRDFMGKCELLDKCPPISYHSSAFAWLRAVTFNEDKIERRKTAQGTHSISIPHPIGRQFLMMFGDISGLDFQFFPKLAPERGKIAKAARSRSGYCQIVKVYVFNEKSLIGEAKCQT